MTTLLLLFLLQDAQTHLRKGQELENQYKLTEAIAEYSKAIELDPSLAEAYFRRGRARKKDVENEHALADLTRAVELDPAHVEAWKFRSETNSNLNKPDAALADADRAVALAPKQADLHALRGRALNDLKRYDEAIAAFTKAIEIDPDSDSWYAERGQSRDLKKDYDGAIADHRKAVEIMRQKARTFRKEGDADMADVMEGMALYWELEIVKVRVRKQDFQGALDSLDPIIRDNPRMTEPLRVRAGVHTSMGRHEKALADRSRVIKLDGKDADGWLQRALVREKLKDWTGVVEDTTRASELSPKWAWPLALRGNARFMLDQLDAAIADLDEAVRLLPTYAWAYGKRGRLHGIRGDLDRSVADHAKEVELKPKDAWALRGLGQAYYHQGKWDEAIPLFRQACELNPADQDYARMFLWLARARKGERDEATRELKEYLASRTEDDHWALKVLQLLAGALSEEELLKAATDAEKQCEAWFYAGSVRRIAGESPKSHFQKCVDTGVRSFIEYEGAVNELRSLK